MQRNIPGSVQVKLNCTEPCTWYVEGKDIMATN